MNVYITLCRNDCRQTNMSVSLSFSMYVCAYMYAGTCIHTHGMFVVMHVCRWTGMSVCQAVPIRHESSCMYACVCMYIARHATVYACVSSFIYECICYPMNLCINCMLPMEAYWTYNSVKLCILYHFWMIFVLVFCLLFCVQISLHFGISILIP